MKVYIGPYKNWFGPYQLAESLCFWAKKEKDEFGFEREPDWVHNFGNWLAHGSWDSEKTDPFNRKHEKKTLLYKFLIWIDNFKVQKKIIKIDPWDTWSMDSTLAPIILPMLKQLKATKHGSPSVDLEDVPEEMRTVEHKEYESQQCFDFYHEDNTENKRYNIHDRWEYVLDEMIFAFDHLVDDSWEDKYSSGEMDHYSEPCEWDENGKPTMHTMKEGSNHTYKCDYDGLRKEWDRVNNGLRLFGKYYRGLWD
jgi:YD repeat-containing protein